MRQNKELIATKDKSGEWLESENCLTTDINRIMSKLFEVASDRGFQIRELGMVGGEPILLLSQKKLLNKPNVLIAAGFHGDEPAGSWGILHFLKTFPKDLITINFSFLPLVNPTGFRNAMRTNNWGEDPNRGFYHTISGKPEPSREGLILLNHLSLLKYLAKDIFVSLHEDWELSQFYIYTFEDTDTPGIFSDILRSAEAKFFEPYPDGPLEGGKVKDGIIFKLCDGAFEDLLFHEGVPRTACTESPGNLDINKRIEANSCIIDNISRFAISIQP